MVSIKGQSEIFGFIILVVFLVFLGLVFLGFFLLKGGEEIVQDSGFANSLANSFMKAKGGYGDYKGALAACCEGESFGGFSDGCEFLENFVDIAEENSGYEIRFEVSGGDCLSYGNCVYGVASNLFEAIFEGGTYGLKVYVCKE